MFVETSDFLLSRMTHQLQKQIMKYRQPISSIEGLVVIKR
jgi:hypothetical protein